MTQHGHGELGDERLHNIGNVRVQRGAFVTVQVAKYLAILRTRSVHGALKLSRKVGVGGRQASRLPSPVVLLVQIDTVIQVGQQAVVGRVVHLHAFAASRQTTKAQLVAEQRAVGKLEAVRRRIETQVFQRVLSESVRNDVPCIGVVVEDISG